MTDTVGSLLGSVVPQLVSGGGIGFAVGWVAKKVVKIVAAIFVLIMGGIAGGMYYAQGQGWITLTVNWSAISASTQAWVTSAVSNLAPVVASVTAFTGATGAGFLLGLKTG